MAISRRRLGGGELSVPLPFAPPRDADPTAAVVAAVAPRPLLPLVGAERFFRLSLFSSRSLTSSPRRWEGEVASLAPQARVSGAVVRPRARRGVGGAPVGRRWPLAIVRWPPACASKGKVLRR